MSTETLGLSEAEGGGNPAGGEYFVPLGADRLHLPAPHTHPEVPTRVFGEKI